MEFINNIWSFLSHPSMLQAIMILFLVSGIGMYLGKFKIGGITLGLSFVFFIGILVSHFGIEVDADILNFTLNLGLILFVYTLGLQVGPSFVESLKRKGLTLNLWALSIITLGVIAVIILYLLTSQSLPDLMGVLSGAVTNMPALGAAQEAVAGIFGSTTQPSEMNSILADMATATAVTYPIGVVGVFIVLSILKKTTPKAIFEAQEKKQQTDSRDYIVANESIYNKKISEIVNLIPTQFVISHIWRGNDDIFPNSDTIIKEGDHIQIVCDEEEHDKLLLLFGEELNKKAAKETENEDNKTFISKRILVTKKEINGQTLGGLRLRNKLNINITSITRAGVDLLPSSSFHLQLGDRLQVVGKSEDIDKLSDMLGNQLKKLDSPYLVTIFVGMFLGCVLGSIPIYIPGISTPIRMGIAGGPLIIGILMGTYGARLHLATYVTQSANLMLRTIGIVLFMAALGLSSGKNFFETLSQGPGLIWMGLGAIITIVPPLIIGLICTLVFKVSYSNTAGIICGSMANPIALDYATSITGNDTAAVSYVTVYPLTMFLRVIFAQLTIGLILG